MLEYEQLTPIRIPSILGKCRISKAHRCDGGLGVFWNVPRMSVMKLVHVIRRCCNHIRVVVQMMLALAVAGEAGAVRMSLDWNSLFDTTLVVFVVSAAAKSQEAAAAADDPTFSSPND